MSKSFFLSKTIPAYITSPFLGFKSANPNEFKFCGGVVSNLNRDFKRTNLELKQKLQSEEEFYLNIKFFPLSPKIEEIKVLSKDEVIENKTKSDDLLNIYIPILKINSDDQIIESTPFHSQFLIDRRGSEKPLSGFFSENKVYLSGFLVKSPDGIITSLFKNQDLETQEDHCIFLSFSGKIQRFISNDETNSCDIFLLEGLGLSSGASSSGVILSDSFVENDVDQTRSSSQYSFSFNYPIGQIKSGNFISLARGSVTLFLETHTLSYFKETYESEPGCFSSKTETKTTFSIEPDFE